MNKINKNHYNFIMIINIITIITMTTTIILQLKSKLDYSNNSNNRMLILKIVII